MRPNPHNDERTIAILNGVADGQTQPQIEKTLGINHSNAFRRFLVLERAGYIKRRAKGKPQIWELTATGSAIRQTLKDFFDTAQSPLLQHPTWRWHDVMVIFPYLQKPPSFAASLQKRGFIASQRRNYSGWENVLEGCVVFASPVSVWVMLKSRAASPSNAAEEGLRRALEVRTWLEHKFSGLKLNADGGVHRQHLAMEDGVSALLDRKFRYRSDRLMVDASTGKVELETVSTGYAHEDAQQLMATLEQFVREPRTLAALKYLVAQGYGDAPGQDPKQQDLRGYA